MTESDQQGIERLFLVKPESIGKLIDEMSAQVYAALKLAVEISKWPDGRLLTPQQRDFCMQAVILFEAKHLPEQDRIGFDLSASCNSKTAGTQTITVAGLAGSASIEGSKG